MLEFNEKFLSLEKPSSLTKIVEKSLTQYLPNAYFQPEFYKVDCICKSSALLDEGGEWKPAKDDYYDQELEDKMLRKDKDKKAANQAQQYTKRVITHQSFLNIGFKEAEAKMADMDQGDVIIRPSSKGEDRSGH